MIYQISSISVHFLIASDWCDWQASCIHANLSVACVCACACVCVDRWLTACGLLSGGEGLTQGKGKWETEPHDKRPDLPLWVCSENSQTIKAPWVCLIVTHTHTHTHTLKNPPHAQCVLCIAYACMHGVTSLQWNNLGILETKFQFSMSDPKITGKSVEAFLIDVTWDGII